VVHRQGQGSERNPRDRRGRAPAAGRAAAKALLCLAWFGCWVGGACAGDGVFYKEAQVVGAYSSRDEWTGEVGGQGNSVGFEDYRRYSGSGGDFLTTDVQVRLALYASRATDVWGIEVHNAYAAYKVAFGHRLRLGHFDVPFGLEPVVDTHGTLLQTLAMSSTGFKQDWGVGLAGGLGALDYQVAAQIGSGMALRRKDGSFVAAGRVGASAGGNAGAGVSLLCGRVLESMGMETIPANRLTSNDAIEKRLAALDGNYLYGPVLLEGEMIYGESGGRPVFGYLAQADCTVQSDQNWHIEAQFQSWTDDLGRDDCGRLSGAACVSYRLSGNSLVRAALMRDFEIGGSAGVTTGALQFYYYGD